MHSRLVVWIYCWHRGYHWHRIRINLMLWFRVMIRQIKEVSSRRTHPAGNGTGCR